MNSVAPLRRGQRRSAVALATLLAGALAFVGCNLLTGVSRLTVVDDEGAGGSNEGGAPSGGQAVGGNSSGGAGLGGDITPGGASNGDGGGALGGFGGDIVQACKFDSDCDHPDGCLLGDCQDGSCFFSVVTCDEGRTCDGGECLCDEGTVDCDGNCLAGVCCPGQTDGGCGNCGVFTCKGDRSAFECQGEGECQAGEVCGTLTLNLWSDGSSCGCGLQSATCSQTCEKGACQ